MICALPGTSGTQPLGEPDVTGANPAPHLGFRSPFVYALVSQRARGISVGVNLNPDKTCNFDCLYCEVDRSVPGGNPKIDAPVMARKLQSILEVIAAGGARTLPGLVSVPEELATLKEVALSGDGEPTLCPNFEEAVEAVLHVRAGGAVPFFKIVLLTNGTGLHRE